MPSLRNGEALYRAGMLITVLIIAVKERLLQESILKARTLLGLCDRVLFNRRLECAKCLSMCLRTENALKSTGHCVTLRREIESI